MCIVLHIMYFCVLCLFFKHKTAYEMRISDWSSDVCSSDLVLAWLERGAGNQRAPRRHVRDGDGRRILERHHVGNAVDAVRRRRDELRESAVRVLAQKDRKSVG